MIIQVFCGDWAKRYTGKEEWMLTLEEGAAIRDILATIGLPEDETGMTAVNGAAMPLDTVLRDGDTVKIYPVIIAG